MPAAAPDPQFDYQKNWSHQEGLGLSDLSTQVEKLKITVPGFQHSEHGTQ